MHLIIKENENLKSVRKKIFGLMKYKIEN
jgi:hypothetical protein